MCNIVHSEAHEGVGGFISGFESVIFYDPYLFPATVANDFDIWWGSDSNYFSSSPSGSGGNNSSS